MKFIVENPKKIALVTAILLLLIAIILDVFYYFLLPDKPWMQLIFIASTLLPLYYIAMHQAIDRFIYKKIKLIYKTIHKVKVEEDNTLNFVAESGQNDFLENVNRDVEEWAKQQTAEITHLRELAKYRREFVGNVSHELKTPIFNIQGYILTLLDGGLNDPNINVDYLNRSMKSVDRMIALVTDLEKISQLESGVLELRNEIFNIGQLVREVIEFMDINLKKNNVQLLFSNESDGLVEVMADKEKIREVIINLIDNAIKYSQPTKSPKINIGAFDMGEQVLIEVSDNGIGISEQDIPRVFERFYRVERGRSREKGGTGLGLSIVKHIIEAHHQTINIQSNLNEGTTISFTLMRFS